MDENRDNTTPPEQPENVNPEPTPTPETPGTPEGTTPPPPPVDAAAPAPGKDAKNLAMLAHILGFFTSFIGPLVIWLMKKEEDRYIEQQSREALNFQITIAIAGVIGFFTSFICIGFIILPVVGIADIVLCIMAAVAASDGKDYRYPFTLRLVK